MKSIFYFYDEHIQDKVIINESGMDRKKNLTRGSNNDRTVQPVNHESGVTLYGYYTLI